MYGTLIHVVLLLTGRQVCQKRPMYMSKETCVTIKCDHEYTKRAIRRVYGTLVHVALLVRSRQTCQKGPMHISKETYAYIKKIFFLCQKRVVHLSKKIPMYVSKETYLRIQKDLCTYPKSCLTCMSCSYAHCTLALTLVAHICTNMNIHTYV